MKSAPSLALVAALFAAAARASDNVPAPAPGHPVVLRGATVHPVSGPDVPNGTVVLDGDRIVAVGGPETPVPPGAEIVELGDGGRHVYPGLVAANSVLGLAEIPSVRATLDATETGALNPDARALVAVNPDSELLPVTRANGVLAVHVVPATAGGGLVSGRSALVRLDGWTWEEMTVRPTVGLHVFWPSLRLERDPRFPKSPEDQQKDMDARRRELREVFARARAYAAAGATREGRPTDIRLEAMVPVVRGELPVFVHADEARQITDAVAWAEREKLRLVLVGGADAWRVADLLKARDVPVIVAGTHVLPARRWEGFDARYALPARLLAAGVRFCVAGEGSDFAAANERNLPYEAAQAAAHGLPRAEALRAVTLYPAQILGAADRLGSLEPGKEATLFVWDGDPLEIATHVSAAYVAGRPVDLSTKQTRLNDKYRQRYGQ